MPVIKIGKGSNVRLSNIGIVGPAGGIDIGIQGEEGASLDAENLYFENVRKPYDMPGNTPSSVVGTRIKNQTQLHEKQLGKSFSGWTRPHGPPLPAFCPQCKAVFASRSYNFGSSRFYSRDNEETCPECDFEHAKLSDGLFDLTGEAVSALSAPEITYTMLAAIAKIANAAAIETITPSQAVAEIEQVRPAIAQYLRNALQQFGPTGFGYLSAALAMAAVVYAHVQTAVSIEGRDLAREQTEIAREALKLQKEQPNSEKILEKIARELAELRFTLVQPRGEKRPSVTSSASGAPNEDKALSEPDAGD